MAARADVSVTWCTWLEQGRGGPPPDGVLEWIALALELDALPASPAFVKTPTWDIVAWNAAATAVLADYAALPAHGRNVLRRLFGDPAMHVSLPDWEADARFAVAVFRVDNARAGCCHEAAALASELQATSADFRRLWAENDVRSYGVGLKRLHRPPAGPITLEYSAFAVDGANGLSMVVYTPASPADAGAVKLLLSRTNRGA